MLKKCKNDEEVQNSKICCKGRKILEWVEKVGNYWKMVNKSKKRNALNDDNNEKKCFKRSKKVEKFQIMLKT